MLSKTFLIILIFSSSNAILLNCTFGIAEWMGLGEVYYCYPKISFDLSNETVSEVVGTHLGNRTNNDVLAVSFSRGNLTFVPQGLTNFFHNMIALYIGKSDIRILYGHELNGYPNLRWLSVEYDDQLEAIGGNLFSNLPNIRFISIHENKNLDTIGWNILDKVNPISHLYFLYNSCVNMESRNNTVEFIALKNAIRANCSDFNSETTTTETEITFPTTPDVCLPGDIDERVCALEEENRDLLNDVENLTLRMETIEEENAELREKVEYILNILDDILSSGYKKKVHK